MADETTEELVRQIHREVNGLTRPRRSAAAKPLPPSRQPGSGPGKRSKSSGERDSSSRSTSQQHSGKDQAHSSENKQGVGPSSRPSSPWLAREGPRASGEKEEPSSPPCKRSRGSKSKPSQTGGEEDALTTGAGGAGAGTVKEERLEPQESTQIEPRGSCLAGDRGEGGEVTGAQLDPARYSAAAALASKEARAQARLGPPHPRPDRVKCFYAGVRWGLALGPAALASRAALAEALNGRLRGEGVRCGRGDGLHVVFLDTEGRTSEFPPLSEAGWRTAAASGVRVYVRQGVAAA